MFRQISYAQSAADGILHLIEITHSSFGSPPVPIRLAANTEDVVYGSNTYTAFPFDIRMPALRDDGTFQEGALVISAVNQQLVAVVRNITTPATISHFTVFISAPGSIAHGPFTYSVRGAQRYTRRALEIPLRAEPVLEEECPWKRLSPSRAPGLF